MQHIGSFLTTHPTLLNEGTMTPGISDHDGIPMIDLSTKPKTNRPQPRKIFQFHKADNESIKQDPRNLSDTLTNPNNSEATFTCLWKEFKDGVLKAIDDHIPTKIIKKRDQTPWINSTLGVAHAVNNVPTTGLETPTRTLTGRSLDLSERKFRKTPKGLIGVMPVTPALSHRSSPGVL